MIFLEFSMINSVSTAFHINCPMNHYFRESATMYKRFLIIMLILTSSPAFAGTAVGHIGSILIRNDKDTVLFSVTTPIHNTPACNETNQFAIHLNEPGGKAIYKALLTAKRMNDTVMVDGTKSCSGNWKSEDVRVLRLD